ncbi:MAG TPA: MBL fold metallo-hydrolase [Gemmatimonadales bacterium]|jgi:phosphoribosyl 1,2-cyclic phosphate phosphodiesterase|nr:MBL fold metallo-hydrolase [Gemmatimonadales bacterium]
MRLTLLGTGTSMGVPQIGCDCAVCRSDDPRDQRSRTSALVEANGTRLLIDTPPELRLQLLRAGVHRLDAVLYTHQHADHIHGIDDLRSFSLQRTEPLPLYGSPDVINHLQTAFQYIFDERVVPIAGTSKPRLVSQPLAAGTTTTIAGLAVLPLAFEHGPTTVYGYRVGPVAYLTDVKRVPAAEREQLRGVKVLVLNALWWRSHPTHLSIDEAVETARAIGAERTYLTHLTHETGHRELLARLPAGIEPAFDGLSLEIAA